VVVYLNSTPECNNIYEEKKATGNPLELKLALTNEGCEIAKIKKKRREE
jgi:hypothetical protein